MDIYFLVIIIPIFVQICISIVYKKYKSVESCKNLSGFEVARKVLDKNDLEDIYVVETRDMFSHYDSNRKVIKLTKDIFNGTSILAVSLSAYECIYAVLDKEGKSFIRFRNLICPVISLINGFAWLFILLGIIVTHSKLIIFGASLIGIFLLFHVVTLPIEFGVGKKAYEELKDLKLIKNTEHECVKNVIKVASMTYIASVFTSVIEVVNLFDNRN